MRLSTILVTLGALAGFALATPAAAWSQGWDWDEDFQPAEPDSTADETQLTDTELNSLSEPLCVQADTTCQIHA